MANPLELKYLPIYKAAAIVANAASSTPMPSWYPGCAAAEAWCETGGFGSFPDMPMLADGTPSYNCLGIKVFAGWAGSSVTDDGTEELPDGEWTGEQMDNWCVFPSFGACFAQQLVILQEARYAAARAVGTPQEYIAAECPVWSTNRQKAAEVLATWQAHQDLLA